MSSNLAAESQQHATDYSGKRVIFRRVAIIGMGLIGGSVGLAIRERGLAGTVVGIDSSAEALQVALDRAAVDTVSQELAAISDANCVVFASPVGGLAELMSAASGYIDPASIVTDVGSVKRRIVAEGLRLFGRRFVGGHPMAGSERNGITAARGDLFEGAPWAVVTADAGMEPSAHAINKISELAAAMGAHPIQMTAGHHDHLVSLVSHLPHALSYAFTRTVGADSASEAAVQMAGASYRDFSRVSHSSPHLWADILLENRGELISTLDQFEASLHAMRAAIESDDRDALLALLRSAQRPDITGM